jgi:gamma-glutamyltranspeptidase/glutathione hydrolase
MSFWLRPTGRSDIVAKNGVVASSQPLATQAGLSILQAGGNAVDAAVATAAVLDIVEPFSTGCGGDAFVLIHQPDAKEPLSFNGSGRSGSLFSLEDIITEHPEGIPVRGGLPVTVPGAMHLWCQLVRDHGSLEMSDVLAPAIFYASDGFPVSPLIAKVWKMVIGVLQNNEARDVYTIDGRAPRVGETMKNPGLAKVFQMVVEQGPDAFYKGEVAESIVETIQAHCGAVTLEDLGSHQSETTKPIKTQYHDHMVFEHPPNGQGFAALIMLNIMAQHHLQNFHPQDTNRFHIMIEAKKLAYADLYQHNTDPAFYDVPLDRLLSKEYAWERNTLINRDAAMDVPEPGFKQGDDTIYLATADQEGRAVSFINSLYMGFGSGLVVPGWGIKLQNRGNLFSVDPEHPNRYEKKKRPFHTIIPGALYCENSFVGVFGIMGGAHQAQAHAQFVSNVVDHGFSPQAALDFPRFNHVQTTNSVGIENGLSPEVKGQLRLKGHRLIHETMTGFGGGQAIFRKEDAWIAGSDKRKDGQAAGF